MELSELISSLSEQLETPDLALNQDGVAAFTSEDGLVEVSIEQAEPGGLATIYSVIGQAPEGSEEKASLFGRLLEAQLFGQRIGTGASFGLDHESGDIFIWREFDPEATDRESFLRAVGSVYHWSSYWLESLAEASEEESSPPEREPGPDELPPHFLRA